MVHQWIKVYMLTIYIINVECDDIILSHHLHQMLHATSFIQLMEFELSMLVANYNRKLKLFS